MKSRADLLVLGVSLACLFGSSVRGQFPEEGMLLWLDASDGATITTDAGFVTEWRDKSGNGFHAWQDDAARQPVVEAGAFNGTVDAVRFDAFAPGDGGNNGMWIDAGLVLGRPYTAIIVDQYWGGVRGRTLQGRDSNWLIGKWGGNTAHFTGAWVGINAGVPASELLPSISVGRGGPSGSLFSIDGQGRGGNGVAGSPGALQLGVVDLPAGNPPFDEPSQADVGEVLIYDRMLGDNEKEAVEAVLGSKYGVPVVAPQTATRVVVFNGADAGEGLDFSGTFLHAVDAAGAGGYSIGDATFTDDVGVIEAENTAPNWFPANFASDGVDDDNLNALMRSIRWTQTGNAGLEDLRITLDGLTSGRVYKLQLLFADHLPGNLRHFNVLVDGDAVVPDFQQDGYTGDSDALGSAVVHRWVATGATVEIVLEAASLPVGGDRNPLVMGATLEDEGEATVAAFGRTFESAADLDFSGEFVHAVDLWGGAFSTVGDAVFQLDDSPGVSVVAENNVDPWGVPEYGDTPEDNELEFLMSTIRWTATSARDDVMAVDLDGLTSGERYKLQLLFDEASNAGRGFDITVEGVKVVDDFRTADSFNNPLGQVVTVVLTAADDTLNLVLEGMPTPAEVTDKNPLLCALTLEKTDESLDSDGDGLADPWELENFGNLAQGAADDPDGDLLPNSGELAAGSDPNDNDSDDDELTDKEEVDLGTNPLLADTDGDTLSDGEEVNTHGTNPLVGVDTDLDRLFDDVESITPGVDPAVHDTDGDGYGDGIEVREGTAPDDAADFPMMGTTFGNFAGGDIGDGLDLDGEFVYAVNVSSWGAVGLIRDADFTDDLVAGVDLLTEHDIPNWWGTVGGNNHGDSADDLNLALVTQGIRWASATDAGLTDWIELTLGGLELGQHYKLQLLFSEVCCPQRGFDVAFDGVLAIEAFSPGLVQGEPRARTGAVIMHDFVADSTELDVLLDGTTVTDPGLTDHNAILSGFTLEKIGEVVAGSGVRIVSLERTESEIVLTFESEAGFEYAIDYKAELGDELWADLEDSGVTSGTQTVYTITEAFFVSKPGGYLRVRDRNLQPVPNP